LAAESLLQNKNYQRQNELNRRQRRSFEKSAKRNGRTQYASHPKSIIATANTANGHQSKFGIKQQLEICIGSYKSVEWNNKQFVSLKIGSYVDVSSPVAEIVDNSSLHLDLQCV
jgi:hypothetical protein